MNHSGKDIPIGELSFQERHDQEIRYDPVPGYRPAFFLLLCLAVAYLVYVFQ